MAYGIGFPHADNTMNRSPWLSVKKSRRKWSSNVFRTARSNLSTLEGKRDEGEDRLQDATENRE